MKGKEWSMQPEEFAPVGIPDDRLLRLRAWATHFYTSLGLVASLLALVAIAEGRPRDVFICLGIAFWIDGTDGMLARRCDVKRWTPNFDGRKLDDITDYLTYVFIPIAFAFQFQLVARPWILVLCLALVASAYGFSNKAAKTNDGFFTGFPSYWNFLVLYLYLFHTSTDFNGWVFLLLSFLVFVPIKYLYPTQAPTHRTLNLALVGMYGLMLIGALSNFDRPNLNLLTLSLLYPAYYLLLSFYLHFKPRLRRMPRGV